MGNGRFLEEARKCTVLSEKDKRYEGGKGRGWCL